MSVLFCFIITIKMWILLLILLLLSIIFFIYFAFEIFWRCFLEIVGKISTRARFVLEHPKQSFNMFRFVVKMILNRREQKQKQKQIKTTKRQKESVDLSSLGRQNNETISIEKSSCVATISKAVYLFIQNRICLCQYHHRYHP